MNHEIIASSFKCNLRSKSNHAHTQADGIGQLRRSDVSLELSVLTCRRGTFIGCHKLGG